MQKKHLLAVTLAVFTSFSLWAKDFGLIMDNSAGFGGTGAETAFDYSGIFIPRFETRLGDSGSLYISAGMKADFVKNEWAFIPELLRTEFSWRFGSGQVKAGRIQYADPLGYIANGLFDGAWFGLDSSAGTFSVGVWYTGFLFKKRAYITMTDAEKTSYDSDLDYDKFVDTYFAPKRVIAALGWEHPGLGELVRTSVSLLGQLDLGDDKLHTQYMTFKVAMPLKTFVFDLGGSVQLAEDNGELGVGIAADLGVAWELPGSLEDNLSFLGRFSSGKFEDNIMVAFQPLTTVTQGEVLEAKLSGLSTLTLDYLARLHRTLSLELSSSYFIRSDLGTSTALGTDGYFGGNEFYGKLSWSPFSDLQLNLGGGIFVPSLGDAAPDEENRWKVELNVILSLY